MRTIILVLDHDNKWVASSQTDGNIPNMTIIPRVGETIKYKGTWYPVEEVSHDYDAGEITVTVKPFKKAAI